MNHQIEERLGLFILNEVLPDGYAVSLSDNESEILNVLNVKDWNDDNFSEIRSIEHLTVKTTPNKEFFISFVDNNVRYYLAVTKRIPDVTFPVFYLDLAGQSKRIQNVRLQKLGLPVTDDIILSTREYEAEEIEYIQFLYGTENAKYLYYGLLAELFEVEEYTDCPVFFGEEHHGYIPVHFVNEDTVETYIFERDEEQFLNGESVIHYSYCDQRDQYFKEEKIISIRDIVQEGITESTLPKKSALYDETY